MHTDGRGELPMNADEYRRRAGRCLVVARQTANPDEKARTVDTALMWMELAEWAEGKWPQGKHQQQVQPEESSDGAEPLAATLRATSDRPE
jgi:hypothetical protein